MVRRSDTPAPSVALSTAPSAISQGSFFGSPNLHIGFEVLHLVEETEGHAHHPRHRRRGAANDSGANRAKVVDHIVAVRRAIPIAAQVTRQVHFILPENTHRRRQAGHHPAAFAMTQD